ncbi:hypothetical protein FQR65_LT20571 [Abscondita terminalis]|nr:hypothetical protein FQR65_LT20571 [Abscondita terminalis]
MATSRICDVQELPAVSDNRQCLNRDITCDSSIAPTKQRTPGAANSAPDELLRSSPMLRQLGKTPFINKLKPTPLDEAASLAWYLENVFYKVASEIQATIDDELEMPTEDVKQLIELGFWPGGDR